MGFWSDDLGQKSIPVGALSPLPEIMRDFGQDPWELLEAHGVTARLLADPKRPALPITLHGRIVQDAAAATQCDHLGLLLGQRGFLDNTGPLRFLILNTPTVREAIEALIRFSPICHRAVDSALSYEQRVAALFAVHRLTLHRHLARHDTTFEALVDDTRRRLAEQMLTYTDLPIAEVAGGLGYRNQGNFTRAFRRWHDTSPRGWRGRPPADPA
ncbi:AraC-like DNA-binding protein [Nocardia sp. GAS34]|uniref:helix-turn-helix transcriptional regulator n=1 Tax=unclassified Nocardia TaxID=2637762 RepID=UPI003D1DEE36